MYRVILCLLIVLSHCGVIFSQLPDDFPSISAKELPGASVTSERSFTGTALYGYINGGADLYLEYGFKAAKVTELSYRGGNYRITIYKMNDQEGAFGIFSVTRFKCISTSSLPGFTCQTRFHLQIARGTYYVSIINSGGSDEEMAASVGIVKLIAERIEEDEIDLSSLIPGIRNDEFRSRGFLAKGRLGIVNGSPDLEDYFRGINGYTAVIIPHDNKLLISVRFNNPDSYNQFAALHNWDNEEITETGFVSKSGESVRKISDNRILIVSDY